MYGFINFILVTLNLQFFFTVCPHLLNNNYVTTVLNVQINDDNLINEFSECNYLRRFKNTLYGKNCPNFFFLGYKTLGVNSTVIAHLSESLSHISRIINSTLLNLHTKLIAMDMTSYINVKTNQTLKNFKV